jgi:hypothetical protein
VKHDPLDPDRAGVTFQRLDAPCTMRIGQTAYVPVYANKLWNDSGIDVVSGQVFSFAAPPGQEWTYWQRRCSADGYASSVFGRPLEVFRRVPRADWLQLVCTIGKSSKRSTIIGSRLVDFAPAYRGRLYLFANDLPWMYWNNRGMIAVRITRTK